MLHFRRAVAVGLLCGSLLASSGVSAGVTTITALRDSLSHLLAGTWTYSYAGSTIVDLFGVSITSRITMDYRRDGAMRIDIPSPLMSIQYRCDGRATMIVIPQRGVYTIAESLADTAGFTGDLLHDIPSYAGLIDLLLPPLAAGDFRIAGRETIATGGTRQVCTILQLETGTGVSSHGDTVQVSEARLWVDDRGIPWRWQATATMRDERFQGVAIPTTASSYVARLVFDVALPDSLFRLDPPPGLQEVAGMAGLLARTEGTGQNVSGLEAEALDGGVMPLIAGDGRPTLIEFWATWCHPCRRSLAEMVEHADTLRCVANVVLVATEEAPVVRRFLASRPVPFPVILDPQRDLQSKFRVRQLPTTVLVDGEGTVTSILVGRQEWPDLLDAIRRSGMARDPSAAGR